MRVGAWVKPGTEQLWANRQECGSSPVGEEAEKTDANETLGQDV
jgi:hypothetical protein